MISRREELQALRDKLERAMDGMEDARRALTAALDGFAAAKEELVTPGTPPSPTLAAAASLVVALQQTDNAVERFVTSRLDPLLASLEPGVEPSESDAAASDGRDVGDGTMQWLPRPSAIAGETRLSAGDLERQGQAAELRRRMDQARQAREGAMEQLAYEYGRAAGISDEEIARRLREDRWPYDGPPRGEGDGGGQ